MDMALHGGGWRSWVDGIDIDTNKWDHHPSCTVFVYLAFFKPKNHKFIDQLWVIIIPIKVDILECIPLSSIFRGTHIQARLFYDHPAEESSVYFFLSYIDAVKLLDFYSQEDGHHPKELEICRPKLGVRGLVSTKHRSGYGSKLGTPIIRRLLKKVVPSCFNFDL